MIHRFYQEGKILDVAGLNRITVLLDRSETELTEVGWNCWRAGLNGPPHQHDDKDQVFYVTNGEGTVVLGEESHKVEPGNAVYVPAGLVHQTITGAGGSLCYILLNIFRDPGKEGHATFEEHIEKVRLERKAQAEAGRANSAKVSSREAKAGRQNSGKAHSGKRPPAQPPDGLSRQPSKQPRFFKDVYQGKVFDFGSNTTTLLLDRNETNRFELVVVEWPPGNRGAMVAHKEKEQTFFIRTGSGSVTVGEDAEDVKPGDLVFVPRNTQHTTESFNEKLSYLCLNCSPVKMEDASFEAMFNRIAPQRIKRWKSGSKEVGV